SGEIRGMVVRPGAAVTLADHLTVWEGSRPVYRPTVLTAYCPNDDARSSLLELEMRGWNLQRRQRILTDEITGGRDELGALLLGHDFTGWWTGSLLDIATSRELAPGHNATVVQVAASLLAAARWMIEHPAEGVRLPEQLPCEEILESALEYLGETLSVPV